MGTSLRRPSNHRGLFLTGALLLFSMVLVVLSSVDVLAGPDLTITKTNDLINDEATSGVPFTWIFTIRNVGDASATFNGGEIVLNDHIFTGGMQYATPVVTDPDAHIGNPEDLTCVSDIISEAIYCSVSATNSITIPVGGYFLISVEVDPEIYPPSEFQIDNPDSGGDCVVDFDNAIAEDDETNNSCSDSILLGTPDLVATLSDNKGGIVMLGSSFTWAYGVSNLGIRNATFPEDAVLLRNELPPTGLSYDNVMLDIVNISAASTGTINCGITSNVLECTASGGTVVLGTSSDNFFSVTIDVTTTTVGTYNNPPAGGVCKADPDNVIGESDESNNCSDTIEVTLPDLIGTFSNDLVGNAIVGVPFNWQFRVSNIGGAPATFPENSTILRLDIAPEISASLPFVIGQAGVSGGGQIVCENLGKNPSYICTATYGDIVIAPTGSFVITMESNTFGPGSFIFPRYGCSVDTSDVVEELDEANNGCSATVIVEEAAPSGSSGSYLLGDANNDGVVNGIDARICLQISMGLINPTAEQQDACDVNGDGYVTEEDAMLISEMSIGIIKNFATAGLLAGLGIVFLFPLLFSTQWRLRRTRIGILVALITLGGVTGCGLFPPGTTALYAIASENFITITVQNMPGGGLATLEAKAGGFTFDPNALRVQSLQPVGDFNILASSIDNANGEVRFTIANPMGGVENGAILIMKIELTSPLPGFSPDQTGVMWRPGKLTLGDSTNMTITTAQYETYP